MKQRQSLSDKTMARRYSGKKGKSGSTKPHHEKTPQWIKYSAKEVEQLVLKLTKEHYQAAQIGLMLRDTYGIPSVRLVTNKSIATMLQEHKQVPELPDDVKNLIKREVKLTKHLEKNKHDMTAKRGLGITQSKIHRLRKYYTKTGRLPKGWTYSSERASLLVD